MTEVKGNGNIVSHTVNVSSFVRLHLGCTGTIELHQSNEEKVVIEADENLLEFFAAGNAGRTLYVSTEEGTLKRPAFTSCVVKVYLRQLNVLYVRNEGGHVICPEEIVLTEPLEVKVQSTGKTELWLNVPSLKILGQSHGDTVLKGKAGKLEIKNQSHGYLDASQLEAGELSIKNMAHGNVWLQAEDTINISHYGHGFIHYAGNAVVKDIKHYGHGQVKHVDQHDDQPKH